MGAPRSKAPQEEILGAFHTDEGFKAVAKRLGLSPNTLRVIWKDAFGETAFEQRGKTLQARAAANTARSIATTRVYGDVSVPCSVCGTEVSLKTNQAAQLDRSTFVCDDCKYDRTCPVCGQLVDGERGLAGHFRHRREAGDAAHLAYKEGQEEARWDVLIEGADYVRCLLCGQRAETLARHLKASHGVTADEYRVKFPDALIRSRKLTEARSLASQHREGGFGKGDQKEVLCPSCGVSWEGSKFLGEEHDLRCVQCKRKMEEDRVKEEATYWIGKTEPEDYVECRLCGWKGSILLGHLLGAHSQISMGQYRGQFPDVPIAASGVMTYPTHKLNLTLSDLAPFKDNKGRVQVALAADSFGCAELTVRIYCKEFGLPTRNRLALQKRVLDTLAGVLDEPYKWEWWDRRITNPLTGYYLYFDGYFPQHNLLVEVQGKQHYVYIPYWHKARYVFEQMQERDRQKLEQATKLGFKLLTLRWDEPINDAAYLRRRLMEMGFLW